MAFNFEFTKIQLQRIIGVNPYLDYWHNALCDICPEYEINTKIRLAAFLAQCAHESGGFRFVRENLNYRAESLMRTWPARFPSIEIASQYANKPEKIANKVYANRMGNGNEASGDGWRYLGRGLIQLTGKENYQWFAASINLPLEDLPEYMSTFEGAVQSACFFWENNNLNKWADQDNVDAVSDIINLGRYTPKEGDSIGYADRVKKYNLAKQVLGV